MIETGYICQENEEEDSPAFKISLMNRYDDSKTRLKKCRGNLITATKNNTDNTGINRTKITRKQKWEEKQLYGYFMRKTSEISHRKTWT